MQQRAPVAAATGNNRAGRADRFRRRVTRFSQLRISNSEITMDKKTFTIGILTVTAVIMFVAQLLPSRQTARARRRYRRHRDYQLVTSRLAQGGEALYVVDARTGMMAVFTWDPTARSVKLHSGAAGGRCIRSNDRCRNLRTPYYGKMTPPTSNLT